MSQYFEVHPTHPQQRLLIAENFFYRDDLRLARSLLDLGAAGRVNVMAWRQAGQYVPRAGSFSSTPWRQRPQYRGGPHLDGGVHMIAQLRLLHLERSRLPRRKQDFRNAEHPYR